jgi:hypothetical protein
MRIIPFRAEHYHAMELQPQQQYIKAHVLEDNLHALEDQCAFTIMREDVPLMCYGWVPVYPTRVSMWAILSAHAGPHMRALTRIALDSIEHLPHRRIEIEVDYEFEQGHRWAKMLGFSIEVERLKGYRMDGGDSALYARWK